MGASAAAGAAGAAAAAGAAGAAAAAGAAGAASAAVAAFNVTSLILGILHLQPTTTVTLKIRLKLNLL